MRNSSFRVAGVLAFAVLAALAACDRPKARRPAPDIDLPLGARSKESAPAQATGEAAAPMPDLPRWAKSMVGRPVKDVLPETGGTCIGNTDAVEQRYTGTPPGVAIQGWGWDMNARKAVARVLLVDKDGQVVGAGEAGLKRPDVVAVRKEVTDPSTGWRAVTPVTSGVLHTYGIVADGRTSCLLGVISL